MHDTTSSKDNTEIARRRLLSAVVEASRDAIWSWTPEGIITSWNAEAERIFQYKPEEIIGKSILILVVPDRMATARDVIARLCQGGWFPQYDTMRLRKDGVAVPVELTVSPIRDESGAVIGAATVCRDITARKKSEQALEEIERRFSKIFDVAPIPLTVSTVAEGRYLDVNEALLAMTGYAREEVIGRTARELDVYVDPADYRRIREGLAHDGSLRGIEVRLRGKQGDVRTALLSAEIVDFQGSQCLLTGTIDITDRTAAEAAVAASEARYRALVENANDIVALLDLEFRFTSVNRAVERILGYAPQEIIGTPLTRYIPEEQLHMHGDMLQQKLGGIPTTQYEMQLYAKDRRRLTLEVNSRLLLDDKGKPIGIHAVARDITERKEAEARQMVLVRELQHRTKNLLAVIQSIATHTLRRSADLESANEALVGRLHALAHAQEFVAAGPSGGALLSDLVAAEVERFAARASIQGDRVVLNGPFAQNFALVLHELATNATKYGALSVDHGLVEIRWKTEGDAHNRQLRFAWIERGGPPVTTPTASGFGTQILKLVGGAELAFGEAGFAYQLTVPLAETENGSDYPAGAIARPASGT